MSAPVRIQLRRIKGWRMPPNTVKVDRRTKFGNPFDLRRSDHCWTAIHSGFRGDRLGRQAASVAFFFAWIASGSPVSLVDYGLYAERGDERYRVSGAPDITASVPPSIAVIREELAGKNLGCWCHIGEPCHADVLLEVASGVASPVDLTPYRLS